MRRLVIVLLIGALLASIILSACAAPTQAPTQPPIITVTPTVAPTTAPTQPPTTAPTTKPTATTKTYTWKATTFLPKNMFSIKSIYPIAEKAKTRSNGQLVIQYLGGPEVMPPPAMAEAVRRGVVQMAMIPVEYYEGMVGIGTVIPLSEITPDEERANGAYDYINSLHNKVGLFYLERGTSLWPPGQFNIITNKWIDRPQELKGQKIGASSPIITPFLNKIGAAAAIIQIPEFYAALERGVVDGVSDPLQNHMTSQLYQVCKYVVDPAFYTGGVVIIINLDVWNELPKNLQTLMTDIARETLKEYVADIEKEFVRVRKVATDNGMKFTQFSEEDKAWFLKTMYDAGWEDNAKRYPDVVAKLRPLFAKKS